MSKTGARPSDFPRSEVAVERAVPEATTVRADKPEITAVGTADAPIHLAPTTSPQGSLTAPRPVDGTAGGSNAILNADTGTVEHPVEGQREREPEANVSSVDFPITR